jgi:DNA polymerase-4
MTSPAALIAHVDLDAFFASCEQRDRPEYRGKPLIVGALPGGRGVVAACSYEARVFGVHSAMPISQAHKRCPDAIYLKPDINKYRQESRRIMQLLDAISPVVEKASIDEAYIDITGLEKVSGTPAEIGQAIRQTIFDATGLTASVGIGPNRLIAKLGSEACKPDGLKVITESEVLDFLAPMPVANLRGLGKQTLKKVALLGVSTVGELRGLSQATLEHHLGTRAGASFYRQARGIASANIITDRQRKSISKETTFDVDVADHEQLHDVLRELAAAVARTARHEQLAGRVVTLKVRYRGFETFSRQTTLAAPTQDERLLLDTAWTLFNNGTLPDKPVRLIGIGISGWDEATQDAADPGAQADLFAVAGQGATDRKILDTIDQLTDKYGKTMLKVGLGKQKR